MRTLAAILFLLCCITAACESTIESQHRAPDQLHQPNKPDESIQPLQTPLDWVVLLSVISIGAGVAVIVWLPVEETLGLAIAAGAATTLVTGLVTKVMIGHPWIIYTLMATMVIALILFAYENWFARPNTGGGW